MRFYLPPERWASPRVSLDVEESHHAAVVLRVKEGAAVSVLDGAGRRAAARVVAVAKKEVVLELSEVETVPLPSGRLALAVAVPKGSTIEWIIEKAVELGASELVPLLTERTIFRLPAAEREERARKWRRLALEACKQCGQPWLPVVYPPSTWAEALARHPAAEFDLPLLASLEEPECRLRDAAEAFRQRHQRGPRSAIVLIGPEGDLTPGETRAALDAGFQPVSLGPLVLRVETAALAALAVLGSELGR